ncbi:dTDP-4-dehydrorhamnose reductase [Methylophilus sp. Q8]|uniref:dTDP-4-dehydrorhamnose reductase n=1 Tax=Methylophilus sp. Q8 TaxID=1506586 RepID=UPI000647AD42|nr:dTDP-4-dehydrorhamnose reductase [Methylophilus sp. Q8]
MKILLIGKSGQLGSSILQANKDFDILAPDRAVLDIDNFDSVENIINNFRPKVVINTAAFHNVPLCETQPLNAFNTNCVSVGNLAKICKKYDTKLITFSTDYVFDGEKKKPYVEDDQPKPLQYYGVTRLAGEQIALGINPQTLIIRTCGLYGFNGAQSKGGNFVDQRINDARNLRTIEMGCDQTVSPTNALDLAEATLKLIKHYKSCTGIYHLANAGSCTWYEFTLAIYQALQLNLEVIPINRNGLSGEMKRPLYSALANTRANALGITMRNWELALKDYIERKYG